MTSDIPRRSHKYLRYRDRPIQPYSAAASRQMTVVARLPHVLEAPGFRATLQNPFKYRELEIK